MLIKTILGVLIGGGLGFGLYYFIGCETGTCPLYSNPYSAIVLGALFGFIIIRT